MVKKGLKKHIEEWVWAFIVVFFVIRPFFLQAYRIPSGSMEDTLLPGDFLFVFKPIFGFELPYTQIKFFQFIEPNRGDIVVFRYPVDPSKDFVKRVIGLAGDTVMIRDKRVYINGKLLIEEYAIHKDERIISSPYNMENKAFAEYFQKEWENRAFLNDINIRDNFGPVVVPQNSYFVLGDNRDFSSDSRFFGPVPKKLLKGIPLLIYFSWDGSVPFYNLAKSIRWDRIFQLPFLWRKNYEMQDM
ncbi:MAG: signal peptidase I [Candidatus Hydrothermales bacterium]